LTGTLYTYFTPSRDFWFIGTVNALQKPADVANEVDDCFVLWVTWETLETQEVFSFSQPANIIRDPEYFGAGARYLPYYPRLFEVDSEGRLWIYHELMYQIEVFEPRGIDHWRIRREHTLTDYSREYRKEYESFALVGVGNKLLNRKLPPKMPALSGLKWTGRGEMWAFSEAYVDSPLVQVDVFNTEGVYIRAFLADKPEPVNVSETHSLRV